jgi:hypothetical protein
MRAMFFDVDLEKLKLHEWRMQALPMHWRPHGRRPNRTSGQERVKGDKDHWLPSTAPEIRRIRTRRLCAKSRSLHDCIFLSHHAPALSFDF